MYMSISVKKNSDLKLGAENFMFWASVGKTWKSDFDAEKSFECVLNHGESINPIKKWSKVWGWGAAFLPHWTNDYYFWIFCWLDNYLGSLAEVIFTRHKGFWGLYGSILLQKYATFAAVYYFSQPFILMKILLFCVLWLAITYFVVICLVLSSYIHLGIF